MVGPTSNDSLSHDENENQLMTGEAVALDLRPASFVLRAAGAAIDWVVYFGSYLVIAIVAVPILADSLQVDGAVLAAIAVAMLVVMIVVVPTAVELLSHGKSLGKLAIGARIVRDDGGAIGFRHAFMRAMVGVLETYMTFGGLAAMIGLLNGRSKRLGDLVAGTYSQYERVTNYVPPVYGVPVELEQWAVTADVARMPDRLNRRIAQFLHQAAHLTPQTRDRLSRELANEASRYVSPIPTGSAELFLAAVAAVRRQREATALRLEAERRERLTPVLTGIPHGFPDRS